MKKTIRLLVLAIMIVMCVNNISAKVIDDKVVTDMVGQMTFDDASIDGKMLQRGASQVANLWQESDGSVDEFVKFVKENYATTSEARRELFDKLSKAYEVLLGTQNQVAIELSLPTILAGPEPTNIDYIMVRLILIRICGMIFMKIRWHLLPFSTSLITLLLKRMNSEAFGAVKNGHMLAWGICSHHECLLN